VRDPIDTHVSAGENLRYALVAEKLADVEIHFALEFGWVSGIDEQVGTSVTKLMQAFEIFSGDEAVIGVRRISVEFAVDGDVLDPDFGFGCSVKLAESHLHGRGIQHFAGHLDCRISAPVA